MMIWCDRCSTCIRLQFYMKVSSKNNSFDHKIIYDRKGKKII